MVWPVSLIYYRKERKFLHAATEIVKLITQDKVEEAERLIQTKLNPTFAPLVQNTEKKIFSKIISIDEGILDYFREFAAFGTRNVKLLNDIDEEINAAEWIIK